MDKSTEWIKITSTKANDLFNRNVRRAFKKKKSVSQVSTK